MALIIMMMFRPEGIFPSKRRAMELHADDARYLMDKNEKLWDGDKVAGPDKDGRA